MDTAVSATIVAVGKKVLMLLLGDEKGRKFLLYVVGIALFIVSIPIITLLGLFGWMSGSGGSMLNQEEILSALPSEQLVQIQTMDQVSSTIAATFSEAGLAENDHRKAFAIYMGYLIGMENQEGFYENLAACFQNTTEEKDVYTLVSETFPVVISEDDKKNYDSLYGVTPTRVEEEKEE